MSFIDKIKDIVNVPDDEYYDDTQGYEEYDEGECDYEEPVREKKSKRKSHSVDSANDYSSFASSYGGESHHSYERSGRSAQSAQDQNKVVNIHTTTQLQVVLVKPESLDEAPGIADHLNSKQTVVLNLESTQREIARRIVDFLQGVAYANGGVMKRVAASTFIIIPHNVNIVGDLIDELENNGVFF